MEIYVQVRRHGRLWLPKGMRDRVGLVAVALTPGEEVSPCASTSR
jgi:hypothetical protein